MSILTTRPLATVATSIAAAALALSTGAARGEVRTIDGSGNNLDHPDWGMVNVQLLRMSRLEYADGVSAPSGAGRPNPRAISNAVCAQDGLMPNPVNASNFLWQWGQFVDHDLDLTDAAQPPEPFDIPVPPGDPVFDREGTGKVIIPLLRSIYDSGTGIGPGNPRQQINQITGYLDGSQVYGSDAKRAAALRTLDGTGRLKTSPGDLLPFNVDGLPNLGGPDPTLFLAGDIRANEQVGLTSMHTLFMREHNRLAKQIRDADEEGELSGDDAYEMARARVGALIQVITYRDFLPILLGPDGLEPYAGYEERVNVGIAHEFSAATYRVGHTLLSPTLLRLDESGQEIPEGHLSLQDAFFSPWRVIEEGGIEPILRGLAAGLAQNVDAKVIDDVRNFLFLAPDPSGLDLAALNMQRGRDHGLPGYTQVRLDLDLEPVRDFEDVSSDPQVQSALASVYEKVEDVDLWLGAVAEDHRSGALVGELIFTVLKDQFERLRDGDRFWYEVVFSGAELQELEETTLADIIRRNTVIDDEIPDNVFVVEPVCPADVNADGIVNVADLMAVILAWSEAGGPADVDGNGVVDSEDLVEVVLSWGDCDG